MTYMVEYFYHPLQKMQKEYFIFHTLYPCLFFSCRAWSITSNSKDYFMGLIADRYDYEMFIKNSYILSYNIMYCNIL
jgi:hypothetical protein